MSFRDRLRPHDLLRINRSAFVSLTDEPNWLRSSLGAAPWVVVRRAPHAAGHVAVGARGHKREQRCPGIVPMYAIQECITPEKLVKRIAAELLRSPLPPIQCLPAVKQALSKLEWGPAGSVAFQLATGLSCVSPSSDLDLIIRSTDAITQFEARTLLQTIRNVAPTADVLLETEEGGIVLEEYAHHDAPWSLRTCNGPQLVWNLWHVDARGRAER